MMNSVYDDRASGKRSREGSFAHSGKEKKGGGVNDSEQIKDKGEGGSGNVCAQHKWEKGKEGQLGRARDTSRSPCQQGEGVGGITNC